MEHADAKPLLSNTQGRHHPTCFVCGPNNDHGMQLDFHRMDDGAVEACFGGGTEFAGYPDMIHGGVICALLDGAMTNCLFAQGRAGVTVEISVRFRHPMAIERPATVRAWTDGQGTAVHRLAAEVIQDNRSVATATARFLEKEAMEWFQEGST